MNGSYAFGDGFDRRGGSGSIRSRLVHDDQGRSHHHHHRLGGGGGGGGGMEAHFDGGPGGGGGSIRDRHSLYGGPDGDPQYSGGDYGDDYYGRSSHFIQDSCYGGGKEGGRGSHGDKLRDSLLMPEEDGSYNDASLNSSSSSFKTPPCSSPSPEGNSRPGVQFCSSHDSVSAKIAAFDGKEGKMAAAAPHIEIAHGISARLRGAKETWEAVENDFYLPTTCFVCQTDLFCIMDANYVLCPQCKVVSPMDGCAQQGGMDGGVGLGFTYQDLQQWQYEIMIRRQRSGR